MESTPFYGTKRTWTIGWIIRKMYTNWLLRWKSTGSCELCQWPWWMPKQLVSAPHIGREGSVGWDLHLISPERTPPPHTPPYRSSQAPEVCLLKPDMNCLPPTHVWASLACGPWSEMKQAATSHALEKCVSLLPDQLWRSKHELSCILLCIPNWE